MAKPERLLPPGLDVREYLLGLPPDWRARAIAALGLEASELFDRAWAQWAHAGQLAPPPLPDGTPWSTWVLKAGRGFGKTRAGAEWLTALVEAHQGVALRIALVGASLEEARKVMVEGRSGLVEVAAGAILDWEPCRGRLTFRGGAQAQLFSGASPDLLRGPEHHYAWCDELAKWDKPQETWDMLQLGLRLAPSPGAGPQALVTTTPRSGTGSVLGAIMAEPTTVVTGGPTSANPHLPRVWTARMERLYAGTRLGRQELDGEILPDAAGALWTVELIERCRVPAGSFETGPTGPPQDERTRPDSAHPEEGPSSSRSARIEACPERPPQADGRRGLSRRVIAVDPPVKDGTCGIIAVAREDRGEGAPAIAHILADHSVAARSPEGWSRAVAAAAEAHGTVEVVAEGNQGGRMVEAVLRAADPRLRIKLVHAHENKSRRAEPVAHLFEAGRVRLHGRMPALEAQLLAMIAGGGYAVPGQSPDRADAMVWGVDEVMKERAEPRVRVV